MLEAIHVDAVGQAVYEALIDGPPRTVSELHEILDLGDDQVRRAAGELASRGLIKRLPGRPPHFAVVAPDVALGKLLADSEAALRHTRDHADQLVRRFHAKAGGADPAELIEIVTGRSAVLQTIQHLQRGAREQIRALDKPPYAFQPHDNAATEMAMLASGIRYRVIYDAAGLEEFHDVRASIEFGVRVGEEARVMNGSPTKLIIVDDRAAVLPLQTTPQAEPGVIVVRPSALLEALMALFDHLWRQALPLQFSPDDADPPGLSPSLSPPSADELRLLSLLATGLPDVTIAKRLGIAHRTYQRRLKDLFNRLGAQTRFQAGIQATRRGWIID